jgi:tetratricopeptide (TPR) repeat protein
MLRNFHLGVVVLGVSLFPVSTALAQHCQPYWTDQYKCAMGCGPCGGGGGASAPAYSAPAYNAPVAPQPSREELLQRQATALNNQGVDLYNKHKFREAIRMFEASLKVFSTPKTRENLGGAYNQLALEYYNQGNYKEAARYVDLAGQYKPGDTHISSNQAIVRERMETERAEAAGSAAVGQSLDRLTQVVTRMEAAATVPGLDFDNGGKAAATPNSSDALVFLPASSPRQEVGDSKGGTPAGAADLRAPPPNPTLPRVAEIENSPASGEARKAFQAIIAKDWSVAIVWYKQALLKDPQNAALKRALDLAEYTQARRLEVAAQKSPIFDVLDIWRSGDNKTALGMLTQIETQHPEMKSRVADIRHGILLIDQYQHSPAYRAETAKIAKAANEHMLDGELEMAQRSMIDEYVDRGLRFVANGNIAEARLMLKTALAEDDRRGDVRVLLDAVETLDTSPPSQPSQSTSSNIHN